MECNQNVESKWKSVESRDKKTWESKILHLICNFTTISGEIKTVKIYPHFMQR